MKKIIASILFLSTFLYGDIKIGLALREDKYYFIGENGQVEGKIKEFFEYVKKRDFTQILLGKVDIISILVEKV